MRLFQIDTICNPQPLVITRYFLCFKMKYGIPLAQVSSITILKNGGFMKAQTQKKMVTITVLILISLLVTSCGSRKTSGSEELASRSVVTEDQNNWALCNMSESKNFKMNLKVVTDSKNQVNPNQIYVKLGKVQAAFADTTGSLYFWRWKSYQLNGVDQSEMDPTPLYFQIITLNSGFEKILVDWKNSLKWGDISKIAYDMGYSTPEQFFANVIVKVDLKSNGLDYDALKISIHDTETTKLISHLNMLIPAFAANPNDYATEPDGLSPRAQILKDLHPFNSMTSSTTESLKALSNNFCF